MHTRESLRRDLDLLGILPTDTLLVHASGRSVGAVDGGIEAILDAFTEYLRPGLLAMPALSWNSVDASHPEFDVLRTPSCVGALAEHFRLRPGVVRSWHPTHSVCALGEAASPFTGGHERFDTPCSRQSPWGRLLDRRAKILFLGTGLSCNTFLHGVEEWCGVPGSLTETRQALITLTPDGARLPVPSRRHSGGRSKHYAKMEDVFARSGATTVGRFGDARCHLADCVRMEAVTRRLLDADIDLFGHDRVPTWAGEAPT